MNIDKRDFDELKKICENCQIESFTALSMLKRIEDENTPTNYVENSFGKVIFFNQASKDYYNSENQETETIDFKATQGETEMPLKLKYGNGTISKRTRNYKKGIYTYYQGRCSLNGRIITVTAKTQNECAAELKRIRTEAEKSTLKPRKPINKLTLAEWLAEWLKLYKQPNSKPNTIKSIKEQIQRIVPRLGNLKLNNITPRILREFFSTMPPSNTRDKTKNVLNGSLRDAVAEGLLKENPAGRIKLKKATPLKRRAFIFFEQNLALNTFPKKYAAVLFFLFCTGLRIGEFLSLTDSNVNYETHYIRIDSTKDLHTADDYDHTKTGEIRFVPFLDSLFDNVYAILGTQDFFGHYTYAGIKKAFRTYLNEKQGIKDLSPHCARHTFASVCYYARIPDKFTQKWLGHATMQMTTDIYTEILGKGESPILAYIEKLKKEFVD